MEPLGNSTVYEQLRFQSDSEGPHITFAGYERDLARRPWAGYISFMETGHDQRSLEWCFVGSLMVLAIPVLAVAYTIWDAYWTTTK